MGAHQRNLYCDIKGFILRIVKPGYQPPWNVYLLPGTENEESEEEIILVTDGGYDGQDNIALAKEKNVKLVTAALTGKEVPDALADFEFNEDGTRLLKCAAGHEPVS